ncbi:hypothetical protein SAMD00019534_012500 [Acytostelium subglobosum LB1]|uniref:hypothetical protein n=1 Tax=Acytostelium subglobosum LB1 TaxID=1410327 RepID=UPI000644AEBB|nr:hypothetical protein SAMD00019534_012500 [Acytostelium subglobosum LB1]GAM18075.1 hypothetical protein SAMD00019534_012500 [Acytostelium subglobosum LB1]|eukprot:XP_012758671.1 hypothetical protein SAMD00019534_012500 [Acytostelium subglobosum LB1]
MTENAIEMTELSTLPSDVNNVNDGAAAQQAQQQSNDNGTLRRSQEGEQQTQTEEQEDSGDVELGATAPSASKKVHTSWRKTAKTWTLNYFAKFKGTDAKSPKMVTYDEMIFSWLGSAIGIGVLAAMHYYVLDRHQLLFLIASFAASAVLIYGAPSAPLSQPRNLVGGHIISAIVGVTARVALVDTKEQYVVASLLSVSISIVLMQMTKTLHPPGGASALIAVMSPAKQRWAGYLYVLMPIGTGSLIMLLVALLVNNMSPKRRYPLWWW